MEKVAIIGGGASALMCACQIKNKSVVIFEAAEKYGKKILATGNGRCNLTNLNMNSCSYNQNLNKYFSRFSANETIQFFNNIGLVTYADEEKRVYPISNTATSVLSVLKNAIDYMQNVKIETEKKVVDIFYDKNKYIVKLADNTTQSFDKVVVASGNQTNLSMFNKFGIKYKTFVPSLCSIKTQKHKALAGVRVANVRVCCKIQNNEFNQIGEVLFKDDGISGIVIFNLSTNMARINNFNNHKIYLDFLPNMEKHQLVEMLNKRIEKLKHLKVEEFLTGMFHKQLNYEILKRSKINMESTIKCLKTSEIDAICENIKHFELISCGNHDNNQVVSGGILLTELNNNLQSIKQPNLYFIGEIIDVDGDCGGYNLQWAWTSGYIVGNNI